MARILVLWLIVSISWASPNLIEEMALTYSLSADLQRGRLIKLENKGHSFVAILDDARSSTIEGVAILLPDAGFRADSDVLAGLRQLLPAHGWSTLSLQLPVLEPEAELDEYYPLIPDASQRIKEAVTRMKARGIENIALIGHGFGAVVALNYGGLYPDGSVRALVLMSPWWPQDRKGEMTGWLFKSKVPVLDITAEHDSSRIRATTDDRYQSLKGLKGFRQWKISGAGHEYQGYGEALAKRIYGWLKAVTAAGGVAR